MDSRFDCSPNDFLYCERCDSKIRERTFPIVHQTSTRAYSVLEPNFAATARDTYERQFLAPDLDVHLLQSLRKVGLDIAE